MSRSMSVLLRRVVLVLGLSGMGVAQTALSADPPPSPVNPELRAAWNSYYKALDEQRVLLENTDRFRDTPSHRSEAYFTLMEMQAMAYNFAIAPRMEYPRLFHNTGWQTDIYSLGQNGPDFNYLMLYLDGTQTYRLKGRMGDVKLFLIQVWNGLFSEPGVKTIGNYDLHDMKVAQDGTFEIILGGPKREGNWIPLDPGIDYQSMLFRRALFDWHDDPGEVSIERISPLEPGHYNADEFDERALAKRIRRAETMVRYTTTEYTINLYDQYYKRGAGDYKASGAKNKMALLPGTSTTNVGNPASNYAMGVFDIADDEAMLIEMKQPPDGVYWSFQLGTVWSRAMPMNVRQTSLNVAKAAIDKDGGLRVVISKKDPGVANWLDTCDRNEGVVVMRNYRSRTAPTPTSRLVKLADLPRLLPKETKMVTPAEREAALAWRRSGYLKLHGE